MKALIAFLIGAVIALVFVFFVKYYLTDPFRLMFYTVEVKGKTFEQTVEALKNKLNENGLNVIRVLPLSKALEARGVKFMKYSIVLACDVPGKEELLAKVPSISNLIPCSVIVYEDEEGVKVSALKEIIFIAEEKDSLSEQDMDFIAQVYRKLRKTLDEVRK